MVQTFIYDDSSPFASFAYEFTSKERDAETGLDKCALRTNR
jgi:hypothetical protein